MSNEELPKKPKRPKGMNPIAWAAFLKRWYEDKLRPRLDEEKVI